MKFQLVINMERMSTQVDMREVERHTLEMVQLAESGEFESVWAAEHHALEMTIAPNPFQILTWWAAHTSQIRLGVAVVNASYWHPIKLAGEAALLDLYSGGRLEFGIGSGAYQREFDRMRPGLKQTEGYRYTQEMLPAVKALWAGDYAHDGELYPSFPASTSVPKPLQEPHPPIWVAARAPVTFDWAVANECHILSWALTKPFAEVETYMERFESALKTHPNVSRPVFSTMRYTCVYPNAEQWEAPVAAATAQLGRFQNLFENLGDIVDGFPQAVDLQKVASRDEFTPTALRENLMFGTPPEVIQKLQRYKDLGVDQFTYCASFGLGMAEQKESLRLFIAEVMPAFNGTGIST